jgi:hypothetical protein
VPEIVKKKFIVLSVDNVMLENVEINHQKLLFQLALIINPVIVMKLKIKEVMEYVMNP